MASLDLNRATHHPHSHHITILQSPRPSPASWQRLTNGPCHTARRLRLSLLFAKTCPFLSLTWEGSFAAAAWCQNTSALGLGLDPFFRLQVRGKERGEARETRDRERLVKDGCQRIVHTELASTGRGCSRWFAKLVLRPPHGIHGCHSIYLGSTAQPQRQASSRRSTAHVTASPEPRETPGFCQAPCRASNGSPLRSLHECSNGLSRLRRSRVLPILCVGGPCLFPARGV